MNNEHDKYFSIDSSNLDIKKEIFSYGENYTEYVNQVQNYIGLDRQTVYNFEKDKSDLDNPIYIEAKERLKDKLRRGGKANLFFLLTECIHSPYQKGTIRDAFCRESEQVDGYFWAYERCKELEPERYRNGFGDFWARGHLKTTIISELMTTQEILNDPGISIGIFSYGDRLVKLIIDHIRGYFNHLQWLFPEIIPDSYTKTKTKNTSENISVLDSQGMGNMRPAVSMISTGGHTGLHFDIRIYDDLMTSEMVNNPKKIEKAIEGFHSTLFLHGTRFKSGTRNRFIGTYYSASDIWHKLEKSNTNMYKPRKRTATANGRQQGQLLFMSLQQWNDATVNTTLPQEDIQAQYFMNAVEQTTDNFLPEIKPLRFDSTLISSYNCTPYIFVDPAFTTKKGSDYTAILVVGRFNSVNLKLYVCQLQRLKIDLNNLYFRLRELYLAYSPRAIYVEGKPTIEKEIIYNTMKRNDVQFEIEMIQSNMPKKERIKSMAQEILKSTYIFSDDLSFVYTNQGSNMHDKVLDGFELFEKEYKSFDSTSKENRDDILDVLAYPFFVDNTLIEYNSLFSGFYKKRDIPLVKNNKYGENNYDGTFMERSSNW